MEVVVVLPGDIKEDKLNNYELNTINTNGD